jgi:hypothetical protein
MSSAARTASGRSSTPRRLPTDRSEPSRRGIDRVGGTEPPRRCVRTPNFAPHGPDRPGETQVRTAVSAPLLARRKSGVQIPSPPPHTSPGHRPGGSPPPDRRRSRFPYGAANGQQPRTKRPTATRWRPGDGAKRVPGLPITRRMLGVDLERSTRIWPAHVGWPVCPDGSRRIQKDRLDDHWDGQGSSDRRSAATGPVRTIESLTVRDRPPGGQQAAARLHKTRRAKPIEPGTE